MRGTYIGGFPEPERAIRGAPEALRVLRGKPRCAARSVARKTGSGKGARETGSGEGAWETGSGESTAGRLDSLIDLTIVNYCIVNYVCAGINAASQEVFSTCNNRSVCCDVTRYIYICWHPCRISGGVLRESGSHE